MPDRERALNFAALGLIAGISAVLIGVRELGRGLATDDPAVTLTGCLLAFVGVVLAGVCAAGALA